jgi:hypothetical protein
MSLAWGPVDPNTTHQRWSHWTFRITSPSPLRRPTVEEVRVNALKFARVCFKSSVGQVRVRKRGAAYRVDVRIEGPPVHDFAYRLAVERTWNERFVLAGFGPAATCRVSARLIAGSREDGSTPDHLIVAPMMTPEYKVH